MFRVRGYLNRAVLAVLVLSLAATLAGPMPTTARAAALPERPRVILDTTYVPPTGRTLAVPAGGDLQAALNAAVGGVVIILQAGATFSGPFTLPIKSGTWWIIVRTSAADSTLPPPGTRITGAYAGPALPKIVVGAGVGGALRTTSGAHHFRFIGIEFAPTPGAFVYSLIELGAGETSAAALPHDLIFDRCFIHGDPTVGGRRGIAMNSASTAVIDSALWGFTEVGADAQAIASWSGTGPFKIVNNYLEASGENVMFGGDGPSILNLVPADIEVRGNYFFKPLTWKVGDPSYAGVAWTVKNLFELKNAQRVLLDGNIFEHNWVGADQHGAAVLFTVRNQTGSSPWAIVADVTFTHNIVRHATGGIEILGRDYLFLSQQAQRLLIQNNLFDDIGGAQWAGADRTGRLFQLSNGAADVIIDHNTAFQTENPLVASETTATIQPDTGFSFTNTITPNGPAGVTGPGTWGNAILTLNLYAPGAVFVRNAPAGGAAATYPSDNFFPASLDLVGFLNLAGGDYHLAPSSPYKNTATDGRDPGAADTTPPVISSVTVSSLTSTTATITWTTNEPADAQAEYGLTTAYGSSTPRDATLVTTHAASLSGLTAGTLYHYRVMSRDAAGNLAATSDLTVTTPSTGDVTPPLVGLTTPASGATVSGTVPISANASDNTGVVGVQVMLDGVPLAAEVTAVPYAVSWNTTTATSGSHTLTAVARDGAGNRTTSAAVSVTVSNAAPDTTPPVISSVTAGPITSSGATRIWPTAEAADSVVEYGRTVSYGSATPLDANRVTMHTVTLNGLAAGALHHYRVKSSDAAGNQTQSADFTFTTLTTAAVPTDPSPPQDPGTPPPTTATSTQGGSGTASGGGGSSGGGSGFESGGGFSPPSQSSGSAAGGTAPAEGAGVASGGPVAPGPGLASTWTAAVPAQRQSVVWSSLVNVTSNGSSLRKISGCDGCADAGAVSQQQIISGDGYLEFTASETSSVRLIGWRSGRPGANRNEIQFAIRLRSGGVAQVRELGLTRTTTTYVRGDVFRIAVVAGTVRYYKNGRLLYISGLAPAYPLTVGTALISRGATVTNVIISGRFSKGTAMPLDSVGSAVSWSDNRFDGFEGVQRAV